MTDVTISGAGAVSSLAGSERIPMSVTGAKGYATPAQIKAYARADSVAYVRDFAGVDITGATDSSAALQAAIDTGRTVVVDFPCLVQASVSTTADLDLRFERGGQIVANSGTYSSGYVLSAAGSATHLAGFLGANANAGDYSITLPSAPALVAGDLISIYNSTDYSWSGFRAYYRAGEFCVVKSVSGSTVNLTAPLFDSYSAGAVDVYKISPIKVTLDNPAFTSDGSASGLITLDYARDITIINPNLFNKNHICLNIQRSYNGDIFGGQSHNAGPATDIYAIAVGNSQNIRGHGGTHFAVGHAIAIGGDDYVNAVPNRGVIFCGADLSCDSAGISAADFHGNTEFCSYHGCTMLGGASIGGANNSLVGNTIRCNGIAVYAAEVLGGIHTIIDNKISCYADPSTGSRGVIDYGGNSTAINAYTVRDVTLDVSGNSIIDNGAFTSGNTIIANVVNRGSTHKINVKCKDNNYNVTAFSSSVRVALQSGSAASDYIISDGNNTSVAGAYSIYADGDYSALSVLHAQSTAWTVSVTTPTDDSVVTAASKTFKWRFPRTPACQAGWINSDLPGGKQCNATVTVSGQTGTLKIRTIDGGLFTVSESVTLCGEVAIREV